MKKTDYQALFHRICQGQDERDKQKALEELHEIIYTFPIKRYQLTTDVAGDFYLYCVNKIPVFLQEYKKMSDKIPFSAFLAVRLQFLLRNFFRRRKRPRPVQEEPVSWDDILSLQITNQAKPQVKQKVNFLLQKLNTEEKLTLKLHFGFYLTLSELRYLGQKLNDLKKTFSYYRLYLKEVEKSQQELKKEQEKLERYLFELERKALQQGEVPNLSEVKNKKLLEILAEKGKIKLKTVALLMGEHQATTKRRLVVAMEKLMQEKL